MQKLSFPRGRLDDAIAMAWRAFERAGRLTSRVTPAVPILFFGDLDGYWVSPLRIVTVGLNPSRKEFPCDSPYARFLLAKGVTAEETDRYLDALSSYFRTDPYREWFGSFEPLLNGARSSYYGEQPSVALHTDICLPVATDPTWSRLHDVARTTLEADGGRLWHELLMAVKPHVVVVSVARRHLSRIRFRMRTEWGLIVRFDRRAGGSLRQRPYEVAARWYEVGDDPALFVFGPAARTPLGELATQQKRSAGAVVAQTWRRGC